MLSPIQLRMRTIAHPHRTINCPGTHKNYFVPSELPCFPITVDGPGGCQADQLAPRAADRDSHDLGDHLRGVGDVGPELLHRRERPGLASLVPIRSAAAVRRGVA